MDSTVPFPNFTVEKTELKAQSPVLSPKELKGLDPDFAVWLKLVEANNQLSFCLSLLINRGLARDNKEGIEYLHKVVKASKKNGSFFSMHDLTRSPVSSIQKIIRLDEEKRASGNLRIIRWHGILGHHLVAKMENGDWRSPLPENLQPELFEFTANNNLKFFRKKGTAQYQLFADSLDLSPAKTLSESGFPLVGDKTREEIFKLLANLRAVTCSQETWLKNFSASEELLFGLLRLLPDNFHPYILNLSMSDDPFSRYLTTLTVQTWARTWLNFDQFSPRVILPELGLLSSKIGFLGGRIDGLEVVRISGREPTDSQRQAIRKIYFAIRQKTVENLLTELFSRFGKDLEFNIVERKFAVGDGVNFPIISLNDVDSAPFAPHEQQLKSYLILFALERYFLLGSPKIWQESMAGQINYYLPLENPVSHKVFMDASGQEACFKEIIVRNWHKGKLVSDLRGITNIVFRHLKKLGKLRKKRKSQLILPIEVAPNDRQSSIVEIVESYQEFLDPKTKVFEMVRGKDDQQIILINAERLSAALVSHSIRSTYFHYPKGGLISCPFHEDKTPSLFVYLENGHYHCFSCGRHGGVYGSLWNGKPLIFTETKLPRKIKDIVVPPEHSKLMERAQHYLQKAFRGSPAEKYLREQRGLNPEIAFAYGAGYGDGKLISHLLKSGFKPEEINDHKFQILNNRITFPLKIFDKYSNFYGRHIFSKDKREVHRKLPINSSSLPTGAFNMDILTKNPEKVIIIEAVIDALTVIEALGEKNIIAIIGLDNVGSIDALTSSVREISLALDNDIWGREKTVKIYERLKKQGFAGKIENFTARFMQEHPEAQNFKDINEWWVQTKDIKAIENK